MSAPEPQSPLARCLRVGRFGAEGDGPSLQISERRLAVARLTARSGEARAASGPAEQELRLTLPQLGCASSTADATAIWVAPDTWLVLQAWSRDADLASRLARACGAGASVVDQSCQYAALRLSGARARDVLAKGCRIDLHARAFGPGRAAATLIAHVHGIVWQLDQTPTFELLVPASFAEHVYEWLCLSAAEFGYEVRA